MTVQPGPRGRHAIEMAQSEAPAGARRLRKLATLSALRQAALDLVLEHGLDQVTVNDVATAAGVSRRTYFNYFATKEDALVGENPQLSSVIYDAIVARPAEEAPLTAVHAALVSTAATVVTPGMRERLEKRHRLLETYPELLGRHLARYTAFEDLLTRAVDYRMSGQGTTANTDTGVLVVLVSSIVRLCVQRWAEDSDPPLADRLDDTLRTLYNGLL